MSSLPRASAGVRARIADIRDRVRTSEANAPAPPNETSPPCDTFSKMRHSNVGRYGVTTVSYTHLTLPTNLRV